MSKLTNLPREDKKMLNSIFFRSFTIFAGVAGATKQGASGFIYSLLPAINRYYTSEEDKADAMVRHSTWYNITQSMGTFVMGLTAAMERENSLRPDFDATSISAIKTSLMGPLSGIGDSIFWGVVRVIAASVGIALASQGSPLGAILFLLIYNIPAIACRYYMTYLGFSIGTSFVDKVYNSGLMQIVTKAASIVGLMMVGAMTASSVGFSTILQIPMATGDPVMVQTYLDSIFVGLVPLSLTLGCLYLLRKKVNPMLVMLGVMALGIVLAILGVV